MNFSTLRSGLEEARGLWSELAAPRMPGVGLVAVSGMLADQLAKELGRDAEPGAVVVREEARPPLPGVAVHVIAGEPSEVDVAFVDAADRAGVPVVLVQLWPQADWTPPFVLSPFVVECRPGEGFPLGEITARIVEASGGGAGLVARIPALRDAATRRARRETVVRAAVLGARGTRGAGSRALLSLEQARMLSRLEGVSPAGVLRGKGRETAGVAAGLLAAGLGLRGLARVARKVLPRSVADAAAAAGGTWALAEAHSRIEARLGRRADT